MLFSQKRLLLGDTTRRVSPYSVGMWETTDQKNSEYGHFSRSVIAVCSDQ